MPRETFQQRLSDLEASLLKMGTLVEDAIYRAVKSLEDQDPDLARSVVEGDDLVDQMNLDIEQACLELLALQQPMARDLRAISTALKMITDLERIADNAVDIAEVTLRIGNQPLIKPLIDIPRMAEIAQYMVREALNAYIKRDVALASQMIERDHELDHLYAQVFRELLVFMMEDPRTIHQATQLLLVARHLERIGDHATNLGEWVIFMVTGQRQEMNN
ncbi:MAG: phosphate signaling complex protein PhoU [Clostridia bacterium]|nr:phosphate signaling complex protein PhoU [Clostridia bacterium]